MGRLSDRVVVLTGAARGIGRAVLRRFAREEAIVYAVDIEAEELAEVVSELKRHGYRVSASPMDVADEHAVNALRDRIIHEEGQIDVLVNNAGIIFRQSVEDTAPAEWDRLMSVNLRAPYLLCRAGAPYMKKARRGSIINVSSRAATVGSSGEAAYCASKFGIEGFSRAIAKDLESYGIAVNTITPGTPVQTSMSEHTYSVEQKRVWKDPVSIAPAFVQLALQTPAGIHDQYVNAWELSERLRSEGWS